MRLDKYLKVSRLIKRRTVANEACDAGRVMINDKPAKASSTVKAGDVITMVGTTTITSSQDLTSVLGSKSYKAGDTTTVTYIRAGQVYTTELTFGSTLDKPAEAEPQSNIPQQDGGNYEDYYGDMEDFFNQFFGRGYAA